MSHPAERLRFLEELCAGGFRKGYFILVVEQRPFYAGPAAGIYRYFRGGEPLSGTIIKPTGAKDTEVTLQGTYSLRWQKAGMQHKYLVVEVNGSATPSMTDSLEAPCVSA